MAKPSFLSFTKLIGLLLINTKDQARIRAAADRVYEEIRSEFMSPAYGSDDFMSQAMYLVCAYQKAGEFKMAADLAITARKKYDNSKPITRAIAAIFHAGAYSCAITGGLNSKDAKYYLLQGSGMASLALIGFNQLNPSKERVAALLGTMALVNHQIVRLGFLRDNQFHTSTQPRQLLREAISLYPGQLAKENPDQWPAGAAAAIDHGWRNLVDEVANTMPSSGMSMR